MYFSNQILFELPQIKYENQLKNLKNDLNTYYHYFNNFKYLASFTKVYSEV